MANVLATHAPAQSWTFENSQPRSHQFDSPSSDLSSVVMFEAPDKTSVMPSFEAPNKTSVMPTMEDIRAALKDQLNPLMNDEYQSSEEALSPMLDIDIEGMDSPQDADDEDTAEETEATSAMWDEIEPFKIDMAIAICVVAKGRPKIFNVPPRWAHFRRQIQRKPVHQEHITAVPVRTDSLAPNVPARSAARTPVPRLDTRFSSVSTPGPPTTTPSLSISPDDAYSTSLHREASVFSLPPYPPAATLTPPLSEQGSDSPPPSFLQSDPFENGPPKKKKQTHGRLRSISSKFKFANADRLDDLPDRESTKKERRVSLRLGRPATPPSFFDARSSDESMRDEKVYKHVDSAPAPAFIAPLPSNAPVQRPYPRLVARGANEREPVISLPPCPKNYDQEVHMIARSPTMDTIPRSSSIRKASTTLMKRRQSLLGLGA